MCGGFTCTKNALKALNLLYIVLSVCFGAIALYAHQVIANVHLINIIVACGIFLFFLAVLGFVGTTKHSQVLLFNYMVILFILFVVQFSISMAALTTTKHKEMLLARLDWNSSTVELKQRKQTYFNCCGFEDYEIKNKILCPNVHCCEFGDCSKCSSCSIPMQHAIGTVFYTIGFIGFVISITEFAGVWLTLRFRNQKNPRSNSNAFL